MKYSRDHGLNTGIELVKILNLADTKEKWNLPSEYTISPNYPNPFHPATSISYSILQNSMVVIKVYDVKSREVITLVNEEKFAGSYKVNFDSSELSSDVYFYKLEAKDFVSV